MRRKPGGYVNTFANNNKQTTYTNTHVHSTFAFSRTHIPITFHPKFSFINKSEPTLHSNVNW